MGVASINVKLWGKVIGELSWCPYAHNTFFSFTKSYLESQRNVFPLIADINFVKENNSFSGEKRPIYKQLPSFLSESLPDSWEREYIVRRYKDNRFLAEGVTPLKKLAYIRNRGLGALEYEVKKNGNEMPDLNWFNQVADEYEVYLKEIKMPSLFSTNLESICSFGTCSVGLRPKVLLAISRESGEVRSGQIEQGISYDYYILKIGDTNSCMAEIEMSYYQIALAAGIHMMPSYLVNLDGTCHFLTKRYDRVKGRKIHVQSFSSLAPNACSYEELFDVAVKLKLTRNSIIELYRRLIFNILTNNVDDHARNFSFIMDEKGRWSLSPAYDISYPIIDRSGHSMTLNGKSENFKKDDALSIANTYKIINHDQIYSEMHSAISGLNEMMRINGVFEKDKNDICKRILENSRIYND